jgi:N-acetylglucosaminyldiphosphoundecaprenol N-acetyl-beta-D-mannosaminyltransferase
MPSAPQPARRVDFLGCPLDLVTSPELFAELRQFIDTSSGTRTIQFVNGNKIAQVYGDAEMKRLMWKADYVLADGQPMLPMARCVGIRIPERIDGIGLMGKFMAFAHEHGYSLYLLGAKQEIVEACVARIRKEYPNAKIAGYRNGYFKEPEAAAVAAEIRKTQPHILFLGMGTPMKEKFADAYGQATGARVIQGVGGSFDVMAGLVKRSPVWIQKIGFEWLYRVMQEPRRMLWRYLKTNAICLWVFMRAICGRIFG